MKNVYIGSLLMVVITNFSLLGQSPELHIAIQDCENSEFHRLLANADVNRLDCDSNTPLHIAAGNGRASMIMDLLRAGAYVNCMNKFGDSPLHRAVEHRDEDLSLSYLRIPRLFVEYIMAMAIPRFIEHVFNGNHYIVEALLDRGVRVDVVNCVKDSPLHVAIENKRDSVVHTLLTHYKGPVTWYNKYGDTPLHRAVFHGLASVVELLLGHCADVNAHNLAGNTPLHVAVQTQNMNIVERFLSMANIDVNATNSDYETPLHCAASLHNPDIVRALLAHGAVGSLYVIDSRGFTPLHIAVLDGRFEIVKEFTKVEGLDVNITRRCLNDRTSRTGGRTALIDSVSEYAGNSGTAEMLLAIPHIDVNKPDECGRTPLMVAIKSHNPEIGRPLFNAIKKMLSFKEIDVDAQDENKCTALHYAVMSPCAESLVPLILSKSSKSLQQANANKETPISLAKSLKRGSLVELMEKAVANVK